MSEDLFGGAYPDPPELELPNLEGLGQDARRTLRQKALIKAGVHPATKQRLAGSGTCGECAHLFVKYTGPGYWFKCSKAMRDGRGPDMRKWWPACVGFTRGES